MDALGRWGQRQNKQFIVSAYQGSKAMNLTLIIAICCCEFEENVVISISWWCAMKNVINTKNYSLWCPTEHNQDEEWNLLWMLIIIFKLCWTSEIFVQFKHNVKGEIKRCIHKQSVYHNKHMAYIWRGCSSCVWSDGT